MGMSLAFVCNSRFSYHIFRMQNSQQVLQVPGEVNMALSKRILNQITKSINAVVLYTNLRLNVEMSVLNVSRTPHRAAHILTL